MQHCRIGILRRPHNRNLSGTRRDARRCSWISERVRSPGHRRRQQLRILELKRKNRRPDRPVINDPIEECRHRPHATGQHSSEFLINIVAPGIKLPHVRAIYHVKVRILPRSDRQLPDLAGGVPLVHQQRPARPEIRIAAIFRRLIVHLEIIADR